MAGRTPRRSSFQTELEALQLVLALLLDGNVELANTLQRQLVFLHVDVHRVSHKLRGEILTIWRHGGQEETHLNIPAQRFEDVVDLILEATRQHLVGLITDKGEQAVNEQVALAQHVEHGLAYRQRCAVRPDACRCSRAPTFSW